MKKPLIKSVLTVFFFFNIVFTFAQSFGVKAGYSLSTYTFDDTNLEEGLTLHKEPGFHLGLNFSMDVANNLSLESLLSLNTRGIHSKFVDTKEGTDIETTTKLYYLDLPVGLKYKVPVGEFNLFAIGGGYIGSGLFGKTKVDDQSEINSQIPVVREFESPIIFNSDDNPDGFKRLDYGWMYGAGIEYKLISVSFQHLLGMAAMQEVGESRHRVFQISLGYTFKHQAY